MCVCAGCEGVCGTQAEDPGSAGLPAGQPDGGVPRRGKTSFFLFLLPKTFACRHEFVSLSPYRLHSNSVEAVTVIAKN